jgi:cytochrome c peroxidase
MISRLLFVLFFVSSCSLILSKSKENFTIPNNWPNAVYDFETNPLTEMGFQLGRMLFYDPVLSRDSTISCASCHLQATGFAHVDHDLSHGIDGRVGTRSAMTLMNLAWSNSFMWDGGIINLDRQAIAPITSHDEMDENLNRVIAKITQMPKYQIAFKKVFGKKAITVQNMLLALSQFEVSLVSANSKYDQYKRGELVFTEQEQKGLKLFEQHCASCHPAPLFTTNEFKNNGLPIDKDLKDFGRMKITNFSSDSLKFKVPTLRNIKFTSPYMHDGRFENLREVLNHYSNGIKDNTVAKELKNGLTLSGENKTDIIAFLLTLTDTEFLYNPRFAYPRENYFEARRSSNIKSSK